MFAGRARGLGDFLDTRGCLSFYVSKKGSARNLQAFSTNPCMKFGLVSYFMTPVGFLPLSLCYQRPTATRKNLGSKLASSWWHAPNAHGEQWRLTSMRWAVHSPTRGFGPLHRGEGSKGSLRLMKVWRWGFGCINGFEIDLCEVWFSTICVSLCKLELIAFSTFCMATSDQRTSFRITTHHSTCYLHLSKVSQSIWHLIPVRTYN